MPVRKVDRNGQSRLLIDIQYKTRDGKRARFRKDADVQTLTAARAEEKRYLINIAQHGEPYGSSPTPSTSVPSVTMPSMSMQSTSMQSTFVPSMSMHSTSTQSTFVPSMSMHSTSIPSASIDVRDESAEIDTEKKTFAVVVDEFRQTYMITDLKVTTRRGYESVLQANLLPRFGDLAIDKIDGKAAADLDLDLTKRKLTRSTRNNSQIVLRSVLRFAKTRQYIGDAPENLPRLRPVGQSVLEIPTDEQVDRILETATDAHRLTFALMSDAGLRPNEVRALRCKNVQLKWENGEAIGGFVTVREGRSHGEIHTPKTGQREIPISRALAKLLEPVILHRSRDQHVALSNHRKPWSQWGIDATFGRVTKRAGVEGWSVYCLRHFAITSWLRAGIPVHVVQRMAGHVNLSTTQRYVHFLKGDLEEAARRLPVRNIGKAPHNAVAA